MTGPLYYFLQHVGTRHWLEEALVAGWIVRSGGLRLIEWLYPPQPRLELHGGMYHRL